MPSQSQEAESAGGTAVFDFYPEGLPPLMSAHLREIMHEAIDRGQDIAAVHQLLADERARQFRADPEFRHRIRTELDAAGVTCVCATMVSFGAENPHGWDAVIDAIRRYQTYLDVADWLSKATVPSDLNRDGVRLLIGMQNTDALSGRVDRLDELYDYGMRVVQLTYNSRNLVGDGCTERTNAGLSEFGLRVVSRLNRLGMVVDLSHCGERTTFDAIETSDAPPAFTHAFARTLHDHDRGKTDAELRAIADADGYVGVVAVPFFLGLSQDLSAMIDHIDHVVDLVGVERVGIGTDWGVWTPDVPEPLHDGIRRMLEDLGFRDEHAVSVGDTTLDPLRAYRDIAAIPDALEERGYSTDEVRGICGGNFVAYFERVHAMRSGSSGR